MPLIGTNVLIVDRSWTSGVTGIPCAQSTHMMVSLAIRARMAVCLGQFIDVNGSPVSSSFGYYIGGQKGTIFATGFSVFF